MKMMIALIVIVTIVGKTLARAAPFDVETLINHPDVSKTFSGEKLLEKLNEIEVFSMERKISVSETVASLLYETANTEQVFVINEVTVAELIEQNTIQLTDCNLEGFERRLDLINLLRPADEPELRTNGAVFAVNVFALRCLHLAADYCLRNKEDVIKEGISDDKFIGGLVAAQAHDAQAPETDELGDETYVYNNLQPNVLHFIEQSIMESIV